MNLIFEGYFEPQAFVLMEVVRVDPVRFIREVVPKTWLGGTDGNSVIRGDRQDEPKSDPTVHSRLIGFHLLPTGL